MERRIVVVFAPLAGGRLVPPAHAQDLRRCGGAMCGSIERPLNPAQPAGEQIDMRSTRLATATIGTSVLALGAP